MLTKYGIEKIDFGGAGFDGKAPTVVVGMSGGVDSSVAAAVLKWQGYNVVGLFMKNWEEKGENGVCTSEADFADVKRVAEILCIPYYTVNFSRQYMDSVFKTFLKGLEDGITPNPDVLCNREIKFGPFLDYAKKIGADYIATGHYARLRIKKCKPHKAGSNSDESAGIYILRKGADEDKDQSYFLCGLNQNQLSRVLFPVGNLKKQQVREIAAEYKFSTAEKKDSTGICFIGERNFRDFMKEYLGNKPGDIKTLNGKVVGRHEGLMYYTLGQRKGLGIGGRKYTGTDGNAENEGKRNGNNTDRWFVVRKDLGANVLYVNNGECPEMYTKELTARDFGWIAGVPVNKEFNCAAKTRYRQADQKCRVKVLNDGTVKVVFDKPQRAVTPGQWAVLYDGEDCLGGGEIINEET